MAVMRLHVDRESMLVGHLVGLYVQMRLWEIEKFARTIGRLAVSGELVRYPSVDLRWKCSASGFN